MWPTPRASANQNRQTKLTPSQAAGQHGMNLATTAAMWPTPQTDSFRSRGGERRGEKGLEGFFFRYEHRFVYTRRLSDGHIGIVAVLHERMHQIDRFKEDFRD
ncbi:hypothetical protein [Pseudogemmobacter hezensis]|uniref:hypothetical protein n=1 Tax=Pseudogemmobacter hezensis TaxID=2737662 RepID=UPI0020A679A1|nr:hypothetical protein [Pseudogemmobacter hezensis]